MVSDLECKSWKMIASSSDNPASPYAPSFNKNEAGGTIVIGGYSFEKGIRSHPDVSEPAQIVYDISKYSNKYTKFFAFVGKDSAGGTGKIQFSVLVDGKEVAVSKILSLGLIGYVEADISGGKTLTLVFGDGGDGISGDSSAFGNAMLMTEDDLAKYKADANIKDSALVIPEIPKGSVVVSDLEWKSWKMIASSSDNPASPYAPSFNKNEAGGTIVIGGYSFEKGIRSHPDVSEPAQVVYDISEYSDKYTKFFAFVGKDSAGGYGNIQFRVLVDDKEVAVSKVLSLGQIGYVEADVSGGKTLTLVFSDGGDGFFDDSSAFGNPMLMTDENLAKYKESANLNK